ncbi:DUF4328 domain-containing protein, partial [Avibacterium avium]
MALKHRIVTRRENVKKIKYLTKFCLALLLILFAMEVFQFAITVYAKINFIKIETDTLTEDGANFLEWFDKYRENLLLVYFVGTIFIFGFFYLIWLSRANFNLFLLGDKKLKYSPDSAIWWWFVPVANFWVPFLVFKEIITKSH